MSAPERFFTAARSRQLDARASRTYGIPALILMENAGRQVAETALSMYRGARKIAVFCGRGNNGGDGFVAARHLLVRGMRPEIYLAGRMSDVRDEARVNLGILLKLRQKVIEVSPAVLPRIAARSYGLIIDALLGVGLAGEVRGIYKDLIALINGSAAPVLSVDIPSGLDATTGRARGCCVKADTTITFVAEKKAMATKSGRRLCGKIIVADIGAPL